MAPALVHLLASDHAPALRALPEPGRGFLRFARSGGRTHVTHARAESPLRLLTPRNHGHAAWAYLSSFGGGMVDRDSLHTELHVESGASAFVSTQGPTRVFRSPAGCVSRWTARIEDGALLVCAPDPISLFAHANCVQETELSLYGTASCAWLEILTSGRPAHGDRWDFESFDNRFRVTHDGRTRVSERQLLTQAHGALRSRLHRFEALGTLWLLGPRVRPHAERLLSELASTPVGRRENAVHAGSALGEDVSVVRWATTRTEAALRMGMDLLAFIPELLGDNPFARRA